MMNAHNGHTLVVCFAGQVDVLSVFLLQAGATTPTYAQSLLLVGAV